MGEHSFSSFASAMRGGTPLHTFVIEVERLEEEEMGPPTPKPRNLGTVLLEAKGDEGF